MLKRLLFTAIIIGGYLLYLLPAYASDHLQIAYTKDLKSGARQAVIRERIKRNDDKNNNDNASESVSEDIDTLEDDVDQDLERYKEDSTDSGTSADTPAASDN